MEGPRREPQVPGEAGDGVALPRRVPALEDGQIALYKLANGACILIDAPKIAVLAWRDRRRVTGADGIDEYQIRMIEEALGMVPLRKWESKQSACFMIFTECPIHRGLATLGHAEKGSKMNFAMEPFPAGRERCFADSGWQGGLVPLISASRPPLLCRKIAFR